MADNRTGLSPSDIAESFRDRCGDGSVEWVYTPMQTWVLLDAADMLDENDKLVMKLNAEHIVRQNVERESAKLREHGERLFDKTLELGTENAKLRDALKALMIGTYAELCADRDGTGCKMCSMSHGKDECTVVDAMELLGIDVFGETLGVDA